MEIDDEDETEGNEEDDEPGFGIFGELSREPANEHCGGEHIKTCIDALVVVLGQPGSVTPKVSRRRGLHHSVTSIILSGGLKR